MLVIETLHPLKGTSYVTHPTDLRPACPTDLRPARLAAWPSHSLPSGLPTHRHPSSDSPPMLSASRTLPPAPSEAPLAALPSDLSSPPTARPLSPPWATLTTPASTPPTPRSIPSRSIPPPPAATRSPRAIKSDCTNSSTASALSWPPLPSPRPAYPTATSCTSLSPRWPWWQAATTFWQA